MTGREEAEDLSAWAGYRNVNTMNDVLFTLIFGMPENKGITIDFLNAVLEPSFRQEIRDISFLPEKQLIRNRSDWFSRVDAACELCDGRFACAEIQLLNYKDMKDSTLSYWAGLYSMKDKQDNRKDRRPAVIISLDSFSVLPGKSPHSVFRVSSAAGGPLGGGNEIHFLEIRKFREGRMKPVSEMTGPERWMAYFSGCLAYKDRTELLMADDGIFSAYRAVRGFFDTFAGSMQYGRWEISRMDYHSGLRAAENIGFAKGFSRAYYENDAPLSESERKKAVKRLEKLTLILLEKGRKSDIDRIVADEAYLDSLYREFGL